MKLATEANRRAWQPLSPRGVAAFAREPLTRLLLVQFIFALLAAVAVAWFLYADWFPTIHRAIRHLPERGEIYLGKLVWPGATPQSLAADNFLALTVDLNHGGTARSPADVQVEFGRDNVQVYSLFGYIQYSYPKDWIIAFNQRELEPWWGAWGPPLLWVTAGAVVIGLMAIWALLATFYSWAVWLTGFYANRDLDFRAGWKMAGAALMPGALFMTAVIVLYGMGLLSLVAFVGALAIHFLVGWGYLCISPFCMPRLSIQTRARKNPFAKPGSKEVKRGA